MQSPIKFASVYLKVSGPIRLVLLCFIVAKQTAICVLYLFNFKQKPPNSPLIKNAHFFRCSLLCVNDIGDC